jgi:hypothetical protein
MDWEKPGRNDFVIMGDRLVRGARTAEEKVRCSRKPVHWLVGGNMIDHIGRDTTFLICLSNGCYFRGFIHLDSSSRKYPNRYVATLYEEQRVCGGENDGKRSVFHKNLFSIVLFLSFLVPLLAKPIARVVELADTPDLGSGALPREGSSPFPGTFLKMPLFILFEETPSQ